MPQFLQTNDFDGTQELRRVGRVVWRGTVPLEIPQDRRRQWSRVGLNLEPLLKDDPHGLYRIEVRFRPQHTEYGCPGDTPIIPDSEFYGRPDEPEEREKSYWDSRDADYREMYDNRNNPCHVGFYRNIGGHDVGVKRNVMVSDVGLIAKRADDDNLLVVATDLKTAKPRSGADIQVLDFQQTVIAEGETDADGVARIELSRKPFLVIAADGGHKGFLRLNDGESLAVAHFDVSGAKPNKGVKGLFYGERGVWRPGDDIFLTFALFDPEDRLPDDHPVRFELRASSGQLVDTRTGSRGRHGLYGFATRTPRDARTGEYLARAIVGGMTFEKQLKIETVVPNRLKIDLDFGTERLQGPKAKIKADLEVAWLHGATAPGLKADVRATLRKRKTSFDRHGEHEFDDPTRTYSGSGDEIFSGKLDKKGRATIKATLEAHSPPGMLTAGFSTRVFEPGGGFSVDRHTIPFSPYKKYVGIKMPKGDKARGMLLTDTAHPVDIVMVDADGKPKGSGTVQIQLYKIKWRWWWEKGEESLPDYAGSTSYTPIQEGEVKLAKGRGQWKFEIKYPEWGRYLVVVTDPKGGHRAGKIIYVDWPGWAGRAQEESKGGAAVLTVAADQNKYEVGDKATLTVPTPAKGRALVSIESGSRVLQADWVTAEGEQTQYSFEITAEMAPNVYANVTLLQPHMHGDNDLPMRMYGIVPIKVVNPATELEPAISCADVFEPGADANVAVKEAKGREMSYTLAVVDEGLLGLTRFETPKLWDTFYARNALGVRSWDLYEAVAAGYGGKLERLLAIGGGYYDDGPGGPVDERERSANRFPPMVRYYGPFTVAAGKAAKHTVSVPNYTGAVRVMVVAGDGRAYGSAEKSVFVRKPLMVLGSLPRVLGPKENVELPVTVFALEKKVRSVRLTVSVEGPVKLQGKNEKQLDFNQPGDRVAVFKLSTKAALGVAKVKIAAEGNGEKAKQTIEIDVRYPGTRQTDVYAGTVEPGGAWKTKANIVGLPGTSDATLEVSRMPPVNLGQRLDYLIKYPHGCVEQTTSGAFPQLFVSDLTAIGSDQQAAIQTHVNAALDKLRGFQRSTGGFSMWPPERQVHDWSTSYAGHFIVEAKAKGYVPPAGMLPQWQKYQRNTARAWAQSGGRSAFEQSYRLYTLALSGEPDLASMNRLRESQKLDEAAAWRLAAAYQVAGQPEAAKKLINGLSVQVKKYREMGATFGSSFRDRALILDTLVLLGEGKLAAEVAKDLSETMSSDKWLSTQDTAFALVAMSRYAKKFASSGAIAVAYSWKKSAETKLGSKEPVVSVNLLVGKGKKAPLALTNNGKGPVFARLLVSSLPKPGSEKGVAKGLALDVRYELAQKFVSPADVEDYDESYDDYDGDYGDDYPDGYGEDYGEDYDEPEYAEPTPPKRKKRRPESDSEAPFDPTRIEQGTDFVVRVTVRHTGKRAKYEQLVLSHVLPPGWEIHNERLDPSVSRSSSFDYQDIRDDRVYTYFSLKKGEAHTFEVKVHAAYLGKFYLPMISVEAMYDAAIQARLPGQWTQVVKPGKAI